MPREPKRPECGAGGSRRCAKPPIRADLRCSLLRAALPFSSPCNSRMSGRSRPRWPNHAAASPISGLPQSRAPDLCACTKREIATDGQTQIMPTLQSSQFDRANRRLFLDTDADRRQHLACTSPWCTVPYISLPIRGEKQIFLPGIASHAASSRRRFLPAHTTLSRLPSLDSRSTMNSTPDGLRRRCCACCPSIFVSSARTYVSLELGDWDRHWKRNLRHS